MARLVDGDEDVVHARTHGIMSSSDLSFFRDRAERSLREAGGYESSYLRQAYDSLQSFNLNDLRDRVEAATARSDHRWQRDVISELTTLSDFQNAPRVMRRYLMTDDRVRNLHQLGRLDGYGDLYQDEDPTACSRTHQANREVMTGAFELDAEGNETWRTCLGTTDENDEQTLSFSMRDLIRQARRDFNTLIDKGGQDPSSILRKTL